jgi:Ser/Thr protein kinase RdoA (MazF antagonist)
VVKFARVAAADAALDREAEALRALADEHPGVEGVPRLLAAERRVGRRALAESAVHGQPLIEALTPDNYGALSGAVATWLAGLVGSEGPRPREGWWERLVGGPLAAFERDFGTVTPAATLAALRARLQGLDALPSACEHRDCSPWNVVLDATGAPGLHDWESAEPHGLPGLDLAYFLANAAFVLDGALDGGRTRESYRHLLDPATPYGGEAAARIAEYCERTGLDPATFPDLRLLAWVVHARSDYVHREMAAAGTPSPEALRDAPYLGLIETDLALPASY